MNITKEVIIDEMRQWNPKGCSPLAIVKLIFDPVHEGPGWVIPSATCDY